MTGEGICQWQNPAGIKKYFINTESQLIQDVPLPRTHIASAVAKAEKMRERKVSDWGGEFHGR